MNKWGCSFFAGAKTTKPKTAKWNLMELNGMKAGCGDGPPAYNPQQSTKQAAQHSLCFINKLIPQIELLCLFSLICCGRQASSTNNIHYWLIPFPFINQLNVLIELINWMTLDEMFFNCWWLFLYQVVLNINYNINLYTLLLSYYLFVNIGLSANKKCIAPFSLNIFYQYLPMKLYLV